MVAAWQTTIYSLGPLEILYKLPHRVGRDIPNLQPVRAPCLTMISSWHPNDLHSYTTLITPFPKPHFLQQQRGQSNLLAVSLDKHQNASIPSAQSSLVRLHIHAPSRPIKVAAQQVVDRRHIHSIEYLLRTLHRSSISKSVH